MVKARLKLKQQYQLFRDLRIFLQYGYTVNQAFDYIRQTSSDKLIKQMCGEVKFYLDKGYNLTDFFNRTNWINHDFISIISIGEQTARLYTEDGNSSLDLLVQNIERTLTFKKQLVAATSYPLITLGIIIIIAFVLIVFILPKILGNMIKIAGDTSKLPKETLIAWKFVSYINEHLWLTFGVFFGLIGLCIYLILHKEIVLGWLGNRIFTLPVISGFYKAVFYIRFFSSMFMFNTAGMNMADSLSHIYKAEINPFLKNLIIRMQKKVEKGESMYSAIRTSGNIFEPIVVSSFEQAELGGLTQRLSFLISYYSERLSVYVEVFKNIIQPLAIIIVAFIVGGMAILLIRSIYSFVQNIPGMM
jgi:type IV pilus assembly protein PilC